MYEQHFGLKKRPFRAQAMGTDVFVGPHIAATMAGIKSSLSANDAIVSVSGAVGSGKTTLVERALQATANNCKVIRIARMRLDSNDVLEYLLDELGSDSKPKGTIQRFALFRRQLSEHQSSNTRVVIVVEDTVRLGADTLAELEALTASDAGESDGANLVLMGDERIVELLKDSQLERLQQRLRNRLIVASLPVAELRGYLRHCFRLAGNDFESVFEENAAHLLHYLSQGLPRVANNIIDSAMSKAADGGAARVSTELLKSVATDEYGISSDDYVAPQVALPLPVVDAEVLKKPVEETTPVIEEPVTEPAPLAEEIELEAEDDVEESIEEPVEEAIPELIQDTLPDLEILAPHYATAPLETETRIEEPQVGLEQVEQPQAEEAVAEEAAAENAPPVEDIAELPPLPEFDDVPEFTQLNDNHDQEEVHIPELAVEIPPEVAPDIVPDAVPDVVTSAAQVANEIDENIPELPVAAELEIPPELTLAADAFAQPDFDGTNEIEEPVPAVQNALEVPAEENPVAEEPVLEEPVVEAPAEEKPFAAESAATEVPAWERDPTMAELKPDLAALEQAMAFAQSDEPEAASSASSDTSPAPVVAPQEPETVPEITLDNAINQRIDNNLIDEPGEVSAAAASGETPAVKIPPRKAKKADAEVEKIVAELAKAKSIEDVDDRMAETLFGEELNFVAAQVLANGPNAFSANDDLDVVATGQAVAAGQAVESGHEPPAIQQAAGEVTDSGVEVTLEAPMKLDGGGMDLSASQRLKTVRALNADLHPSIREPAAEPALAPKTNGAAIEESPESIEDQITSMTQTLKALDVTPPMLDDDDDGKKGGFFSRFKRS